MAGRKGFFLLLQILIFASSGCQSRKAPPFSPQEALKTFRLAEGFRIELVAAEPEIDAPVAIAFDGQGRLFVVEMPDYPMGSQLAGRIRLLQDLNGDGRFETSSVFAENLHFPTSVMPWKDGVLAAAAPDIFYLADTNRDNRADEKRVVLTGFNRYNPQLRMNGLLYGLDNWIYGVYPKVGPSTRNPDQFGRTGEPIHFPDHPEVPSVDVSQLGTDFRFRPDLLKLEPAAGNSQFGNTFDVTGNRFGLWNNNHIRHMVIENRYLARNPHQGVSSAMHFPSDHENQSIVYPSTENPVFIHESQVGIFTSACGNSAYTGGNFPEKYSGAYFVCEPVHNLVHSDILFRKGATFVAKRSVDGAEFLSATDSWFKPVFTTIGPDGALYVVDYYRKYVEHPDYVPEDMIDKIDLREGAGRGRIYRIVHEASKRIPRPRLHEAASAKLLEELSNPNMWWRLTAQRLLVERQDRSVIPALRDLAGKAPYQEGRIHALWTLEGLKGLDAELVVKALGDGSPVVREQAIRLSEMELSDAIRQKLLEMIDDRDERVVFQLACTIGNLTEEQSFEALKKIANRYLADTWFQIAVLSARSENPLRWFRSVTRESDFLGGEREGKKEFLERITAIIGARQKEREIAEVLAFAEREGEETGRVASLTGLAAGLRRGSQKRTNLSAAAEQALVNLWEASSPKIGGAALDVAMSIELSNSTKVQAAVKKAARVAQSAGEDLDARLNAVRVLSRDPTDSSVPLLDQLLGPQQPVKIQLAAANALLGKGDSKSLKILLEKWKNHSVQVREDILGGIFRNPGHLQAFLDAVEDGRVEPKTLSNSRVNQLTRYRDEAIRKRAKAFFANVPRRDRKKVIEKYRPSLNTRGDVARGKEVFRTSCGPCHRIGDVGVEVGPDLVNLAGRRSKGFLLTEIFDPNSTITAGYEEYLVETKDGRMLTGVIAKDSATAMTLRRRDGAEDTILRSSIASFRASTVSAMPEGLEDEIDISKMADLLEYLHNLPKSARQAQTHD